MTTNGPINGIKVSREFFHFFNRTPAFRVSHQPLNFFSCQSCHLSIALLPVSNPHLRLISNRKQSNNLNLRCPAIDDPHKVVKVIASDGKTGETRELTYTNCKVVGNGSFGVVFQAKLVGVSKDQEDIAIKKVLQDKRFKVSICLLCSVPSITTTYPLRIVSFRL
jgi:hypothetical protein